MMGYVIWEQAGLSAEESGNQETRACGKFHGFLFEAGMIGSAMSSESDDPRPAPAAATAGGPPEAEAAGSSAAKKRPLTPEEQMALYEESLKEDDWGHQPC